MDGMDLLNLSIASDANSTANEAKLEAKKAREANEERLEKNSIFIVFEDFNLEKTSDVKESGFFKTIYKQKLVPNKTFSVKSTDISHLIENTDDYNTVYTRVVMENRYNGEHSALYILMDINQATKYINEQIKGSK